MIHYQYKNIMDGFMHVLTILTTSIVSIAAMFVSTKVIGNKQMSELNMFDYINGITIGSIAADGATDMDSFWPAMLAIAVYTFIIWLTSFLSIKNIRLRRLFAGRSLVLMNKGRIYYKNFMVAKIDMSEFLTQCRGNGYFNLDDIETAIFEQNGKISILPKSSARPVNTKDLNLNVSDESIYTILVMDGRVLKKNMQHCGVDEQWLKKELNKKKIGSIKDIFCAACDDNKTLSVYKKCSDAPKNDVFE